MKKYFGLIIILICLSFFYDAFALKQGEGKDKNKISQTKFLPKTAANPATTVLDINNITSWITSDGYMPAVVGQSWNGSFPKGTVGAIYQEGIVWGGLVNDGQTPTVRAGGNTYIGGTTGLTRVVRVRPDYASGNLTDDAANFFLVPNSQVTDGQIAQIRDQYAKDWQEWPANLGAPFDDKNGNGVYDPNVDIPGIPGASQTIFVSYDDRNSIDNYGSPPIGLKVNETLWSYAIANPLGNVIFKKVQVIYQGTPSSAANSTIDSMYLVQWADPDVGQYTDDFAGSDSVLGLGYAYNSTSNDAIYSSIGSPPPAVGYDFLQGVAKYTGNANDSAIVNLKWRHGYKPVNVNASGNPLSTFVYFAAGGAWQDPSFNYTGTLQWYNLMKGYQPRPPYPSRVVFPASVNNKYPLGGDGTYLLSGDPVAGTGQIDGVAEGAGDRRIVCVTGPFSLSKGDTAEIVVALIGGIGSNNLTSVSVLKFYDKFAQFAYDNLFNLPVYPPPTVAVTNLDGKILLNWANQKNIDNIENAGHAGYAFQGYNVYQLPTSTTDLSKAVRVATFDLVDNVTTILDDQIDPKTGAILQVPVEFGKNTGVSRFITLSNDAIRGNIPMADGQSYYFAVTAYGYNPDPNVPYHALESSPVPILGIPQTTNPGVRYSGVAGDTLKVTHTTSATKSDGVVVPMVVDPTLTTGNPYKITFDASGNWSFTNVATGKALLTGQTNQSGDGNYVVLDGLQVKVIGPPPGVKADPDGWTIPSGARRFTWVSGIFGFEAFGGALGYASPYTVFNNPVNPIPPTALNNVLLKLAKVPDGSKNYDPVFDPADPNMSYGYRYGRGFANAPAKPEFAAHMINLTGVYSYQDYTLNVPISVWNVDDPANPKRLAVGWLENNAANGLVDGKYWPPDYTAYDNIAGSGPREWFFIFNTPYTGATADPNLQKDVLSNPLPVMYFATWTRRGAVPFSPTGSGTDQFEIFPTRPNSSADVFSFTAPAVTVDNNLAKTDVNKVNVFPNPYYGFQSRETSRTDKYVTFNHLPAQATIRIFDLAGVQVRVINKNDNTQFATWDLRNQNNYPIASGIYVVYIDMPGVGATKILKVAVVQEEQILNVY